MPSKFAHRLPAAIFSALVLAAISPALAQNTAKPSQTIDLPTNATLPGVDSGYRIVRPLPEPDDFEANAPGNQFKIGNMDVRIGGDITVDVGAGNIPSPRR